MPQISLLLNQLEQHHIASIHDLIPLIELEDPTPLFQAADRVRYQHKGNQVQIRALLEFSNICRRQCRYCGLNCMNQNCTRYRMSPEDIVATAREAYEAGYLTIVLQSGEDPYYTQQIICQIVSDIKKDCPGMAVTLSIGERPKSEYDAFRRSGADRFLIKQEISDPDIYHSLHPDSCLEDRVACLKELKQLGYETGSGFMIGLPGQTSSTIAQDLLLLQSIPCDMAGIGPFIPHPDTPLREHPAGSTLMTKKAVALARLLLPDSNLPATTALGVLSSSDKESIFSCGANVIMKKVTPWNHRTQYEIYPADFGTPVDTKTARLQLESELRSLGRIPV